MSEVQNPFEILHYTLGPISNSNVFRMVTGLMKTTARGGLHRLRPSLDWQCCFSVSRFTYRVLTQLLATHGNLKWTQWFPRNIQFPLTSAFFTLAYFSILQLTSAYFRLLYFTSAYFSLL